MERRITDERSKKTAAKDQLRQCFGKQEAILIADAHGAEGLAMKSGRPCTFGTLAAAVKRMFNTGCQFSEIEPERAG
jgi:hypothetical protein